MNMPPESAIAWLLTIIGLIIAAALGRRSRTWFKILMLVFAVGTALFVVANISLAACVEMMVCKPLGDAGIVYALQPLCFIPVYWLVAWVSARRYSASSDDASS
jgi:hypothetical protein